MTEAVLRELYLEERLTTIDIACPFGVSPGRVRDRLLEARIPIRTRGYLRRLSFGGPEALREEGIPVRAPKPLHPQVARRRWR